jgi:phosphoribosyl-dephospho-CoA transferase
VGVEALQLGNDVPAWVMEAIRLAPWVVVRRARAPVGQIAVGIRGASRSARFAATIDARDAQAHVTPLDIAAGRRWKQSRRTRFIPAISVLDDVEAIMHARGFGDRWGPAGSVGFELVSGHPAANAGSDLDVVVQADAPLPVDVSRDLMASMALLPVRVDVIVEMAQGAVALADCLGLQDRMILRTPDGPAFIAASSH